MLVAPGFGERGIEGKIRAIGVSNVTLEQIDAYRALGQLDSAQEKYSMLDRGKEAGILPYCAELDIAFLAYSPLAQGLLTSKYLAGVPEGSRFAENDSFAERFLTDENRKKVVALKEVADDLGVTRAQLALAWCLMNPDVSTVITGASRVEQIRENMKALDFVDAFTPELMDEIDRVCA